MTSLMCMLFGHVYEGGRCTRPGCFPQREVDMKISDGAVDEALMKYMKFPSDDRSAMRAAIEAAIAYDEKADGPFEAIEALGEERVFKTKAECVDSTGRICPGVVTQKLGANGLFWGATWEPDLDADPEDQDDYDQPDDPDERARKLASGLEDIGNVPVPPQRGRCCPPRPHRPVFHAETTPVEPAAEDAHPVVRRALGMGFGFLLPQCTCGDVPGPCPSGRPTACNGTGRTPMRPRHD